MAEFGWAKEYHSSDREVRGSTGLLDTLPLVSVEDPGVGGWRTMWP